MFASIPLSWPYSAIIEGRLRPDCTSSWERSLRASRDKSRIWTVNPSSPKLASRTQDNHRNKIRVIHQPRKLQKRVKRRAFEVIPLRWAKILANMKKRTQAPKSSLLSKVEHRSRRLKTQ